MNNSPIFNPASPLYLPYLTDDGITNSASDCVYSIDSIAFFYCIIVAISLFTLGLIFICFLGYMDYIIEKRKNNLNKD